MAAGLNSFCKVYNARNRRRNDAGARHRCIGAPAHADHFVETAGTDGVEPHAETLGHFVVQLYFVGVLAFLAAFAFVVVGLMFVMTGMLLVGVIVFVYYTVVAAVVTSAEGQCKNKCAYIYYLHFLQIFPTKIRNSGYMGNRNSVHSCAISVHS